MRDALLYVWQLPQNLLGLLLVWLYKAEPRYYYVGKTEHKVYISKKMSGGISLGKYIILRTGNRVTIAHEHGHQVQSRYLGWLYLIVVGLWSGLRCGLHLFKEGHYYDAFPENWADRLGGVKRDEDGWRYV